MAGETNSELNCPNSTYTSISMFNIDGYKLYNCNRQIKNSGGVLLYATKLFENNLVSELTYADENFEVVTIEVQLNEKKNKKVTVGCMYRAPNTNFESFNQKFCEYMYIVKNKTFYLCGDLNINLLNYEKHADTNIFFNNLFSFGMCPLINKPSRITKDSATLIDNIFSNNIESNLLSGLLISDITDHLPGFCCSKKTTSNNKVENVRNVFERRLVNDTTLKTLNEKLYEKCDIIFRM